MKFHVAILVIVLFGSTSCQFRAFRNLYDGLTGGMQNGQPQNLGALGTGSMGRLGDIGNQVQSQSNAIYSLLQQTFKSLQSMVNGMRLDSVDLNRLPPENVSPTLKPYLDSIKRTLPQLANMFENGLNDPRSLIQSNDFGSTLSEFSNSLVQLYHLNQNVADIIPRTQSNFNQLSNSLISDVANFGLNPLSLIQSALANSAALGNPSSGNNFGFGNMLSGLTNQLTNAINSIMGIPSSVARNTMGSNSQGLGNAPIPIATNELSDSFQSLFR